MEEFIKNYTKKETGLEYKPSIFDLNDSTNKDELKKLFEDGKISKVIDTYNEQTSELEAVKNPKSPKEIAGDSDLADGVWVYYPWKECLVHVLNKDDYKLLRNSRNKKRVAMGFCAN